MSVQNIKIHDKDNVAVMLGDGKSGQWLKVGNETIVLKEDIAAGHKVALQEMATGTEIIKYGNAIGSITENIMAGSWVHSHNLKTNLDGKLTYSYNPLQTDRENKKRALTFKGYRRGNQDVAIRNEIWIINTVGCINKSAELLAKLATKELTTADEVDEIRSFPHPFGCSQLGDDLKYTQQFLSSLVQHPNAAGVLVMGLGCENNTIQSFQSMVGEVKDKKVMFFSAQEVDDELEEGLQCISELVEYANTFQKEDIPISELKIGLKCGGSDGFSGITGNPLVGRFSDRLIEMGGTAIMTEVPEMFGAETLLMNRAESEDVFHKTVHLVNDFKDYFIRHNQVVYENPSPGNKEGGITTLEEKSLGCVQKGGSAPIVDVLSYASRAERNGLNLLQGPGNDLVSVSNLAASGAHIVLFTTGRGTPYGGPVPTVKISTNTTLARKKKRWIDFNAGQIVEGANIEGVAEELLEYIIKLASGEVQTQNEKYEFKEIAIFKDGVIL
ncbi:LOW QUALITY PROTEIN: altronate hydrolase [Geomicrobium sp. JCM 19039]|nr:LOW QUALITY PROTEIN: altronate hydrolase [Geomicrobium sp. JCM 19039]